MPGNIIIKLWRLLAGQRKCIWYLVKSSANAEQRCSGGGILQEEIITKTLLTDVMIKTKRDRQ